MNQDLMDSRTPQSTNECTYQGKGRLQESLNDLLYVFAKKVKNLL